MKKSQKHVVSPLTAEALYKTMGVTDEDRCEAQKIINIVYLDAVLNKYKISLRGKEELRRFFKKLCCPNCQTKIV